MKRLNMPAVLSLLFLAGSLAYLLPAYAYTTLHASASPTPVTVAETPATPEEEANLAYYVEAQRLDPIFAIEGTNPDKLRTAVKSLFTQRNQIAALYTAGQRDSIKNSLYPNDFLTLLPDLEEARQALLATPSVTNARKYHALLIETITEYTLDARATADTLESMSGTFNLLGYIGGGATTTDVVSKLREIASEVLLQKEKEKKRFDCFEHGTQNCPSLDSLEQARNHALMTVSTITPPGESVLKASALSDKLYPLYAPSVSLSKTIYAVESTCYTSKDAYIRTTESDYLPGQTGRKLAILNDVFFFDLRLEKPTLGSTTLYKELTDAGVVLEYQNIGNLYMCPDSGFTITNVGSIAGVLETIADKLNKTQEEQKLLLLPLVQKADILPYVRSSAAQPSSYGNILAERYLEGSADFDQVLMGAYNDNGFIITTNRLQNKVRYEYMMLARNFASTLLLMGNPTFIPKPVSLFSNHTTNPLKSMYLREYTSDISKQYTDTEILHQVKISSEIKRKLRTQD